MCRIKAEIESILSDVPSVHCLLLALPTQSFQSAGEGLTFKMPGPAEHKLSVYISGKAFALVIFPELFAVSSKSENQIPEFGRCIPFNIFDMKSTSSDVNIATPVFFRIMWYNLFHPFSFNLSVLYLKWFLVSIKKLYVAFLFNLTISAFYLRCFNYFYLMRLIIWLGLIASFYYFLFVPFYTFVISFLLTEYFL